MGTSHVSVITLPQSVTARLTPVAYTSHLISAGFLFSPIGGSLGREDGVHRMVEATVLLSSFSAGLWSGTTSSTWTWLLPVRQTCSGSSSYEETLVLTSLMQLYFSVPSTEDGSYFLLLTISLLPQCPLFGLSLVYCVNNFCL